MLSLSHARLLGLAAALSYGAVSISLTLFNKAVFSTYGFDLSFTVTLSQLVAGTLVLNLLKMVGLIDYPAFSWSTARKLTPLVVSFILMVLSGLLLLKETSVPLFGSFRRLATLFVALAEWYFLGKISNWIVNVNILLMFVFAVVAGIGDAVMVSFSGLLLLLANCVTLPWYLIVIAQIKNDPELKDLNSWGQLLYCNVFSIPIVFVYMMFTGEYALISSYPCIYDPNFQFAFLMSSVQAMLLNYTIFWCTQANSPLTTNVMGQIKNVIVSLMSLMFFNDFVPTKTNVFGLVFGTVSSALYVYGKYLEGQPKTVVAQELSRPGEKGKDLSV